MCGKLEKCIINVAESVGLDQTEAPQNSGSHMSMDLSEDSGQYPQYHVGNNIRITLQAKKILDCD